MCACVSSTCVGRWWPRWCLFQGSPPAAGTLQLPQTPLRAPRTSAVRVAPCSGARTHAHTQARGRAGPGRQGGGRAQLGRRRRKQRGRRASGCERGGSGLGQPGAAPGGGAAERSVLRFQPVVSGPTPAPRTRRPGSDPGAQPVAVTLRRRRGRAGPGWGAAALDPRPAGRWREMSNPGTRRNGSSIKIRLTGRHDRAAALAPLDCPRDPADSRPAPSPPPPLHRPLSRDRCTPYGVRPSLALPAPPPGCSAGAAPAAPSPPSASGPAPGTSGHAPLRQPRPPSASSHASPICRLAPLTRLSPRLFCRLPLPLTGSTP